MVPLVVSTLGLHGSASTWVFNAVRELMIDTVGQARVLAVPAVAASQIPSKAEVAGRILIIKSHHGDAELDRWLSHSEARTVLSVRDPRDASISMTQRFNAPLEHTVRWVMNDCIRLLRWSSSDHVLLRYEDRFFEDPGTITVLANGLDVEPSPATRDRIFRQYRTESVRSFAASLPSLPPERLTRIGAFTMDRDTQVFEAHIGDTRSGKWRDLPDPTRAWITETFRPYLEQLGYVD
jgi:hypothetical protein